MTRIDKSKLSFKEIRAFLLPVQGVLASKQETPFGNPFQTPIVVGDSSRKLQNKEKSKDSDMEMTIVNSMESLDTDDNIINIDEER